MVHISEIRQLTFSGGFRKKFSNLISQFRVSEFLAECEVFLSTRLSIQLFPPTPPSPFPRLAPVQSGKENLVAGYRKGSAVYTFQLSGHLTSFAFPTS